MTKPRPKSSTQRGYGAMHKRRRQEVAKFVAAGQAKCARCGDFILPGELWDLGHVDGTSKMLYSGPEHMRCNRATSAHRLHDPERIPAGKWSRDWAAPDPVPAVTWVAGEQH